MSDRPASGKVFLHSMIVLHQWPLLLPRTPYARVITSMKPTAQSQQAGRTSSYVFYLVLRMREVHACTYILEH